MKIAVNTRLLLKNKLEGIGRFSDEILKRLTTQHPEHTFYFIFDRPYDKSFIYSDNIVPHVIKPATRHPLIWKYWFHYALPNYLRKIKPDIFLSTDGFTPLSHPCKIINVIHDLNFEHFPDDLPSAASRYYRTYFKKYARNADRVITVSRYSKNDIAELYSISENKIDVIYNAASDTFNNKADNSPYPFQYFIYVGSLHPRKNIKRLLEAYVLFKKKSNSVLKMVIVGEKMNWDSEQYNLDQYTDEVIFTGRVTDSQLNALYRHALALTYVPYFEGFGIPLVEAMQCETPIITANVSSLPEIAGDAALYVNPMNVEEISSALHQISIDEPLRKKLINVGAQQKNKFSWEMSSLQFMASIEKCYNGSKTVL